MYTHEIIEESNGWIVKIFKDGALFIYQPHHPHQEISEEKPYWTSREAAEAWVLQTIEEFSNPPVIEHYNEPPAGLTVEKQIENLRAQLEQLEANKEQGI